MTPASIDADAKQQQYPKTAEQKKDTSVSLMARPLDVITSRSITAALPKVVPLTLKRRREAFDHADWLFELKYDGFRAAGN